MWDGIANDRTYLLGYDMENDVFKYNAPSINTRSTIDTDLFTAQSAPGSVSAYTNQLTVKEDCEVYAFTPGATSLTYKGHATAGQNIKSLAGIPNYVYAGGRYGVILM